MLERSAVLDEKAKCSGRVSELCRYVGFGLTIVCFTLLTSTSPFSVALVNQRKFHLVCSALLGCITILCDIIQYMAGYWFVNAALKEGEKTGTYGYDLDAWTYNTREALYWIKQICVLLGSLWLVIIMFLSAI